ncbi:MAG TPA: hypothetical protein VGI28_06445, partial [Stellaceae bacterium]
EGLARSLALALSATGHPPASGRISIFVHAEQLTTKGVTGTDRVLVFGMASYDYNSDAIDYTPQ